jgi:hypothetical protein
MIFPSIPAVQTINTTTPVTNSTGLGGYCFIPAFATARPAYAVHRLLLVATNHRYFKIGHSSVFGMVGARRVVRTHATAPGCQSFF